jgi:uncharacterized protein (TIGR02217 family)
MNDFLEISFPSDISYGSTGGTEYLTTVLVTSDGQEQRYSKWQKPRRRYNVIHGVKNAAQMEELITFFHICRGRAVGFRFKDWSDFTASKQPLLPVANSSNKFQLCKTYTLGNNNITRVITKPVSATLVMEYQEKVLIANQDYEVDCATGIITVKGEYQQPTLKASFEFDVPVRFDNDILEASLDARGIHSCKTISLVEIKI